MDNKDIIRARFEEAGSNNTEKPPFKITPTNKKLLKSSKFRAWLKKVESIVKEEMENNKTAWWKE